MASQSNKGVLGTIVSVSIGFIVLGFLISWFRSGANNAESLSEGIITWLDACLAFGSSLFDLIFSRMPQG